MNDFRVDFYLGPFCGQTVPPPPLKMGQFAFLYVSVLTKTRYNKFFFDRRKEKTVNITFDKIDTDVNMLRVKVDHQNFVDS